MRFRNQVNQVYAERDSVCMADDCNAPNAKKLNYESDELLSHFMDTVARYVPSVRNSVWSIVCKGKTIAYLIFDENSGYTHELAASDIRVSELAEKKIYCRCYQVCTLFDYRTKPPAEMYPECKTLLEKVKAHERR